MAPDPLNGPDRTHFIRRAALAPLCLCLVAALHLARVWTAQQTPWKGGGFGMFSTVDDESARFLRCWLVTDDGEFPILLPPATDKVVAELRAAPTQAGLDDFAQRLAGQSWRWRDERQRREAAAIRRQRGTAITAASLKFTAEHAENTEDSEPTETNRSALAGTEHVLEPIPRGEMAQHAISFASVRVKCLRYRFDAATKQLRAEPMLASTAKPKETESRP